MAKNLKIDVLFLENHTSDEITRDINRKMSQVLTPRNLKQKTAFRRAKFTGMNFFTGRPRHKSLFFKLQNLTSCVFISLYQLNPNSISCFAPKLSTKSCLNFVKSRPQYFIFNQTLSLIAKHRC